jgi:hypothetical protein
VLSSDADPDGARGARMFVPGRSEGRQPVGSPVHGYGGHLSGG